MSGDSDEVAHLEGLIGYRLRRAHAAVSRRFVSRFADLDVRPTQLGVLNVVAASPAIRPSRLGELLGIKRTNVGPLLDGLVRRGLLRREPSSDDRRSQSLFITPAGTALLAELRRREVEHEAAIAALLRPSERARLLVLLARVEAAARAGEAGEGEPGEEAA